jgi:group I intron endonuclease
MKSGVYLLTFRNGSQYVGKSVDIERRWKEHVDAMRSGKAAKSVQYAFDTNGYPSAKILLECHTDHIDIMETYYICKLQPDLNTIAGLAIEGDDLNILETYSDLLKHSTAEHIRWLADYDKQVNTLKEKYVELEKFLAKERLKIDVENRIEELDQANTELYKENGGLEELVTELEEEIKIWKQKAEQPWWKRIFKW